MTLISDIEVALRLSLRNRFISISFGSIISTIGVALAAAQFSGRQPSTVSLDIGISLIRLIIPFVATLLLQEVFSQEFSRKIYLTSITYPRARIQFLLGRVTAVSILLFGLLAVLATALAGMTIWVNQGYAQAAPPDLSFPYLVTIIFIALDLIVVLAIGTLIAVTTTTPSFVLIGSLGFMLIARSYSAVVALLTRDSTLVGNAEAYQSSLSLLGYLLPDLAALDVRMISLYGQWQYLHEDWTTRVAATFAYATALFSLAAWALNRKKFE